MMIIDIGSPRILHHAKTAVAIFGMLMAGIVQAATLVVDDKNDPGAADDGKCSLREAITAINAGAVDAMDCPNTSVNGFGTSDEIRFDAALSGAEIDLNGTELPQITVGLQIIGPVALDPAGITIDAENNSRIFNINGASPMSLSNLTLRRGHTAGDNEHGGALQSVNAPLLSLADVTISDSGTDGLQSLGGGVFVVDGNLNMLRTTLSGNSTAGNGANGGGLYLTAGDLTVNQGLFSGNSTTGFDSDGGGLYVANGNAHLIDSEVSDNFTTGGQSTGGGFSQFNGHATLDKSLVTGNHTEGDEAGGGGLHVMDGSMTLRLDTLVADNNTDGMDAHGGGLFAENASISLTEPTATVAGNSTSGFGATGGGISIEIGTIVIENSKLTDNFTSGQNGRGGGAYVNHGPGMLQSSVRNSIISGNSTSGVGADGGGLVFNFSGTVDLRQSTLSSNSTAGESAEGGGLLVSGGVDATLIGSTVSGNSTSGFASPGGGLSVRLGNLTLINTTVSGNVTKGASAFGGGVFFGHGNNTVSATAIHSTVAFNTAMQTDGDGIYTTDSPNPSFILNNSLIVQSGAGDAACHDPVTGTVNSLATDASCGVPVATAGEVALEPLNFNGGVTQTHALDDGSVAIDAAPNDALCSDMPSAGADGEDQRGVPRPLPLGGECDAGAFEAGATLDMGDAPDADPQDPSAMPPLSYPTLLANNGAVHMVIGGGPRLGLSTDFDEDGQPTPQADGDDLDNLADEEGVFFASAIEAGTNAAVDVTVTDGPAKLNAWLDFNVDGDWDDAGEHIFNNEMLMDGSNPGLMFAVPSSAMTGVSFARFRLDLDGNLTPRGLASIGEVEDYRVFIGPEPTVMFNNAEDNPSIKENAGSFTIPDAVLLSNPSSQEITVEIMFDAGASDAELPADFEFTPMIVTFAPGETRADIEVMIVKDDVEEPDEVAVFNLVNPVNATLGMPATFTATLKDSNKSGGGGGSSGSGCSMGDGAKTRLDPLLPLLILLAVGWLAVGWLTRAHQRRTRPWK